MVLYSSDIYQSVTCLIKCPLHNVSTGHYENGHLGLIVVTAQLVGMHKSLIL